jgi:glycosyltransferase involved in cell wall biosynthesis
METHKLYSMKNLQIGDNDLMGNRFNGHDLHLYLRAKGIQSDHVVWTKRSNDKFTNSLAEHHPSRLEVTYGITDIEKFFSSQNLFYPFSYSLLTNKLFLETDIAHYHLIHNFFFNISHLPILTSLKPSVWTLHDPWALTGHCIHPHHCDKWKTGCGDCPDLNTEFQLAHDTTALNWEIKKSIYDKSDIDIIVASKWMYNLVNESPMFKGKSIHLIPFGLNLDIFKPLEINDFHKRYGIPAENIVIAFRAQSWKLKGLDYLRECLLKLKTNKKITLLTFNSIGLMNEFKRSYQVIDLGWVDDESKLVAAYNAADFFIMPSTAESFGMMAMEAMACAKPVVVFEGTALEDTIFAPEGGIAVPMGDVEALVYTSKRLIENENERVNLGKNALELARRHYNANDYVNKIVDVYNEVIHKRKFDTRKKYIIDQLKLIDSGKVESDEMKARSDEIKINQYIKLIKRLAGNKFSRIILLRILYPILKRLHNFSRNMPHFSGFFKRS